MHRSIQGQKIALKYKTTNKRGRGRFHEGSGGCALVQYTVPHHRHTVTDSQGLTGVVGHDQPSGSANLENGTEFTAQAQPHLHIKIGEGLIQQHQLRGRCQGSGQSKALLLSTGQLMGIAQLKPLQAEQFQQPCRSAVVLTGPQSEASVLPGGEMGEQGVVLEHHADPTPLGR